MARVSVIIPIYNAEDYLEQCLESVIRQTYTDLEIIAVLDGPTDQSESIVKRFVEKDPRIIGVNQPNRGSSAARNYGLSLATGEYVSFIDSDDWIAETYIQRLVENALTSDADMVICNYYRYKEKGAKIVPNQPLPSGIHDSNTVIRELIRDKYLQNFLWNKLIRRDVFEKNRISFPVGLIFEDLAIMSRVAYYCHKVNIINEHLYYYRIRENSLIHNINPKWFSDLLTALGIIKSFLVEEGIYYKYHAEFRYLCIINLIRSSRAICRSDNNFEFLLEEVIAGIKDLLDEDEDREKIIQTKKCLSLSKRVSYELLMAAPRIYHHLSSRKII